MWGFLWGSKDVERRKRRIYFLWDEGFFYAFMSQWKGQESPKDTHAIPADETLNLPELDCIKSVFIMTHVGLD